MKRMIDELTESFFLAVGNGLPRFNRLNKFRAVFYKWAGIKLSKNVVVWKGVDIHPVGSASSLVIGEGSFVNKNFRVTMPENVSVNIGKNVAIGPNVSIETMNHNIKWDEKDHWGAIASSVSIGDKCWIGARVVILGGVTIGKGSVIAAGAIVNKDVPPGTLVGGVPAKFIRKIN